MADGSVVFSTDLDTSGLSGALRGVGGLAKGAGKVFATGFKGVSVSIAAVTAGLGFLAKTAVSYNSSMEQYTTNFGVMLGSEAKAVEHVAQLREMAAKTPFGMEDLANASQTMLSFGLGAEESMVAMQQLGDISLGNKDRFNSLSLAFAQVSAAGKLTGQDLLQMVNAGFNPLQTIAEKTGANLGDLKDVMAGGKGSKEFRKQLKAAQKEVKKMGDNASDGAKMLVQLGKDGAISAEMVGMAMDIETSPGGRFYNGMQKASETFSGMVSTLQDDATALVGKVFEPMTEGLTKNLLPLAQSYIKRLSDAFDSGGTEGLVSAVGDVITDALTKTAEALPSVVTLATNLLTSISTELSNNSTTIADGVTAALAAVVGSDLPETAIVSLGTLATKLISSLSTGLSDNAGSLMTGIANGLNTLLEGGIVGDLLTSAINLVTGLTTAMADNLPSTLPAIAKAIVDGIGTAISSLPELATTAGKLIEGLKIGLLGEDGTGGAIGVIAQEIIDALNSFLSSTGIELPSWTSIVEGIKGVWDDLTSSINAAIEAVKSFFGLHVEPTPENQEAFEAENQNLIDQYALAGLMYGDPMSAFAFSQEEAKTAGSNVTKSFAAGVSGETAALDEAANTAKNRILKKLGESRTRPEGTAGGEESAMSGLAADVIRDLSSGIEQGSADVSGATATVLNTAKTAAEPGQFSSVGAQIAGGIARGITSGTGVVVAAVNRLIQSALAAAKRAADIHSPSRLFRDEIGVPLSAGAAVGVALGAGQLRTAVANMVNTAIPDMSRIGSQIIGGSASRSVGNAMLASAMGGGFTQTNNFNVPVQTPDEFAKTMRLYATYGLQG